MNTLQHIFEPKRLFVVWRCSPNHGVRSRRLVAVIEKNEADNEACLRYLTETEDYRRAIDTGFEGYPAFDLSSQLHCRGVMDAFMRRLPPRKRDDFDSYLRKHRLPTDRPLSNFALLAYTNAKLPSDGFELYPDLLAARPPFELLVEIAGFRHQHVVSTDDIYLGDPVTFKAESDNAHDENAIGIYYGGVRLGFVDRAQAPSFKKWLRKGFSLSGILERINGTPERPSVFVFVSVR